jgi:hypothetical protein
VSIDLVGPDEIASRLGVRSNTVSTWRARGLLPEPVAIVSRVPLWQWEQVRAWADATGRLVGERETSKAARERVAVARAVVLDEVNTLADEALGTIEVAGDSLTIKRPASRTAMRDIAGHFVSLDGGRGNVRGEWDWFYALDGRTREWLSRSHMAPLAHLSEPDQMTLEPLEWVRCLRLIDAASALAKRVPWRSCSHLFVGIETSYDVDSLFGTYSNAAEYLAELSGDPGVPEPVALVAKLGPSPIEMSFEDWCDELTTLEARATAIEGPTGEWDILSVEDQAVYDRLEELLPSGVDAVAGAPLDDLYVRAVGLYLENVA